MSDYIEDCFNIDRLVLILEMLEEEELFNVNELPPLGGNLLCSQVSATEM